MSPYFSKITLMNNKRNFLKKGFLKNYKILIPTRIRLIVYNFSGDLKKFQT